MKKINNDIYARALRFINEKELLVKSEKILLALSAGKDSMTMLDIFLYLRHDLSIDIGVFHLNHMMRGKESDDDERFVAEVAAKNKLELFAHKFDFRDKKTEGISFEAYARLKRYELLDRICRENDFQKIATAHNSDDNIETILMRIFSGTGIHGLTGIDCKRGNIIRPLLFLSAKEIYKHLAEKNIQWREDPSNQEDKYLRNFVRNSLLPKINERFKGAGESILALSGIAGEYTLLINELLREKGELYISENNNIIIEKDRYINNEKLFKFLISKAIRENFGDFVTAGMLEEIYKKTVVKKTNMLLYQNRRLFVQKTLKNNKKVIVISRNIGYNNNNIDWEYKIGLRSNNKSIFLRKINREIFFELVDYDYFLEKKDSSHAAFVSIREGIEDVLIRNRRSGDRINLEHGSKKIKDLMIDNKLDKHAKESIPLLVINSHVAAFLPGLVALPPNRVSVDFYVKSDSKKILAIYDAF